ncbi:hypothetical protein QCA50_007981 [Cerrena zonata]|uniref:Uncharacterized protein n=1 Tax=Cerrena zonata TaxID=2478898 RepID=A0AAW0GEC1_9APHY
MNSHLPHLFGNLEQYKQHLEKFFESIATQSLDEQRKQLSTMAKADMARIATTVLSLNSNQTMDLVFHPSPEDPTAVEEVVLYAQGYLVKASLPPIYQASSLGSRPLSAVQSVGLSGLGCKEFDVFLEGLSCIHRVFGDHISGATLSEIEYRTDHGSPLLFFSNRYFTHFRDMEDQKVTPISRDVDPLGILASVEGGMYTSNNQVQYFERLLKKDKWIYNAIKPQAIRLGHLVEVQCTFSTVPTGPTKYRLIPKLQSICILDRVVENDAISSSIAALTTSSSRPTYRVKRKIGYATEAEDLEESEIKRLREINLDEDQSAMDAESTSQ